MVFVGSSVNGRLTVGEGVTVSFSVVGGIVVTPGDGLVVEPSVVIISSSVVSETVGSFVFGGIVVTPGGELVVELSHRYQLLVKQ